MTRFKMQLPIGKNNGFFLLAVLSICCTFCFTPSACANENTTDVTTETSNASTALATVVAEETSQTEQSTVATTATQATDPATTTVTSSPVTPAPPQSKFVVTPSDRCGCDLTAGSCDVNCCCDGDCSPDDSRAFQYCTDRGPEEPDLKYCSKRDVIFRNRTLFEKRPVGDLLCIVVDNVKKKDVYPEPPEVKTLADAHSLIKDRVAHEWLATDGFKREPQALFKAGSPVLRVDDNGLIDEWRLPTRLFSSRCEATEAVIYLRDVDHECRRRIRSTLEQSCSSDPAFSVLTYHSNFSILSQPDEKLRIESFVCYNGSCLVANTSDSAPRYVDGSCVHVVSEASFRVFHNGADGISKIDAHYKLATLKPDTVEFSQQFSVSFAWASSNDEPLRVSGNPGYITGLPVLAGCFNQNGSACREQDSPMFLAVPETIDGDCSSAISRTAVKFRYNIRTGCLLWPTKFPNCSALQDALLAFVTGTDRHVTHVASFGNANRSRVDDFVSVLVENSPATDLKQAAASASTAASDVCVLPATEVRVYVMHARTEHASRPQEKVVSVLRSYDRGGAAEVRLSGRLPVEVTYVVNFVDVTQTARRIFAPPPTIDARLPQDFFYPFFLESSASKYRSPSAISCFFSLVLPVVFAAADF